MFNSKTKINYIDKELVRNEIFKTLIVYTQNENKISQTNFLHTSTIFLEDESAEIKVTFSKSFYIFYIITAVVIAILPFENALIGSSALALFIIFSSVMYFSLDYKLKTILDGFN